MPAYVYIDRNVDTRLWIKRQYVFNGTNDGGRDSITNFQVELSTNYYPVIITNGNWTIVQFRKK